MRPTLVTAQVTAQDAPAFADQSGGAVLLDEAGTPVRARLDGTKGPLENHPGNAVQPGAARALFELGPHSALAAAENGLFVIQAGWVIAPPWRSAVSPAEVNGAAVQPDGAVWLAHASGLYRLAGGQLSRLDASAPLDAVTAVAWAPAEDGAKGTWFVAGGKLRTATPNADASLSILEVKGLGANELKDVRAIAALGESAPAPGELWVVTGKNVFRHAAGWKRYVLGAVPDQILGAGRVLWLRLGDALWRFDATSDAWETVEGIEPPFSLLAAEASGTAWIRNASGTHSVSRGHVPRAAGLDQNAHVTSELLPIKVLFAKANAPSAVSFDFDEGAKAPAAAVPESKEQLYAELSVGGVDAEGRPRPRSLADLLEGPHTLTLVARFADGSETVRTVPFDYAPVATEIPGWAKDVKPVYDARCSKCHAAGPGRDLTTYEKWKENAPAVLEAIRDRRMPADGPLDPQLKLKLERWVETGARP